MSWRTYVVDSDEEEDVPVIVIDNGTGCLRAGFSGDDHPQVVYSSAIRTSTGIDGQQNEYIGDQLQEERAVCAMRYPIEHGMVTDWNDMERVWKHTFDALQCDPSEYPLLITEVPMNPKSNREKMAQLFFEAFDVPSLNVSIPAVLTVYSAGGRTTGVVVDSGAGGTHIVPVHEGFAIPAAIQRLDVGGQDVTEILMEKLSVDGGYSFSTSSERDIVRKIKEICCFVPQTDREIETDPSLEATAVYLLPDGLHVHLSEKLRCVPEALFRPSSFGIHLPGIPEAIHKCVLDCSTDIRKDLFYNIVLSGGSTLTRGFTDRVLDEMLAVVPKGQTKVVSPPERQYSAWIGASIISGLSTFENEMLVSKQEYEEFGPHVLDMKFM